MQRQNGQRELSQMGNARIVANQPLMEKPIINAHIPVLNVKLAAIGLVTGVAKMKISELIEKLEEVKEKRGDLECWVNYSEYYDEDGPLSFEAMKIQPVALTGAKIGKRLYFN